MPRVLKRACDCCNIRKIKCDGAQPCGRCVDNGLTCTFLRERRKSGPRNLRQSSLLKIWKEQMSSASFVLEDTQIVDICSLEPAMDPLRIPVPLLRVVLDIYREKLYGIWPLLRTEDFIYRLETEPDQPEIYALATALCGATLSNLNQSVTHESLQEPLTAEAFIKESTRVRSTFDYMEPVTLNTILTSYFLHIFYGRQPLRAQTATFYIREAITFAHLFGMHIESNYVQHSVKDQQVMRKLYFLLFMTERYLCIHYGLPTVLESITLPTTEHEDFPEIVSGFLNLVTLFSTPGSGFFGKWTSHSSNVSMTREQLLLIQHALQLPLDIPDCSNDIQKVDIVVSQHWIRSLTWKLSILLGYVLPHGKREMNVAYPLEIAQDALREASHFPAQAFEVHGPGMEIKMYEIASALADSILCQPDGGYLGSLVVGPRDTLKSLTELMFGARVVNPDLHVQLGRKVEAVLKGSSIPSAPGIVMDGGPVNRDCGGDVEDDSVISVLDDVDFEAQFELNVL